jgi:hypothetical protein
MSANKYLPFQGIRQVFSLPGPLVFFLSFGVYLATVAPCVTFWDSGELILGAYSLGLPHPPAYPVFCLAGKPFSFLPFGNVAYRLNIFSAFFGAATVYILYRLLAKIGEGVASFNIVAAALALCFAFYKSFWSVSVVAEVYTLNSFLLAAAFYCLVVYESGGDRRYVYLSVFLLGIALANHQSGVFSVPVFFAYYLMADKNYKKPAVISTMLFLFLFAYSVYMYLPLRASTGPAINIGGIKDIGGFGWAIKWPQHAQSLKPFAGKVLGLLKGDNIAASAGLVVCAACVYVFRRRRLLLLAAFAALANFAGIGLLTAGAEGIKKWGLQSKFYIPSVLFSVVFAAGLLVVLARWKALERRAAVLAVPLAAAILFFASTEVWNNYRANDNSRNFFAYDFGANTLKSVHQDAALFAWGDNVVFPVWYLQGVEKYRDDVMFIHGNLLTFPWYMADIQKGLYKKYGIAYVPRARLLVLAENVLGMKLRLEEKTPTYFDYSCSLQLGIPKEILSPQGLVHLVPSWAGSAAPYSGIWDRYVLRGALDNSTNRAFAAEGILEIYGWESAYWGLQLQKEGDIETAINAFKLSKDLGFNEPKLDKWIQDLEGRRKS